MMVFGKSRVDAKRKPTFSFLTSLVSYEGAPKNRKDY